MLIDGFYANDPADFPPRTIADALIVMAYAYSLPNGSTDSSAALSFAARASAGAPLAAAPRLVQSPVFATFEGGAFIDSSGTIRTTHAGKGTAIVRAGAGVFAFPFTVLPGPPANTKVSWSAAPNNPPDRDIINILVTDAY